MSKAASDIHSAVVTGSNKLRFGAVKHVGTRTTGENIAAAVAVPALKESTCHVLVAVSQIDKEESMTCTIIQVLDCSD